MSVSLLHLTNRKVWPHGQSKDTRATQTQNKHCLYVISQQGEMNTLNPHTAHQLNVALDEVTEV